MNCLTIANLKKKYGRQIALNNISLTLTPGIYGLLGPNGAGKSTLMQILTQIISADQGEIYWNGESVKQAGRNNVRKQFLSDLSYVPQQLTLYPEFTAWEYLDYMASLKRIPKAHIKDEIIKALKDVELYDFADKQIRTFSGGMKQRLMIAQGLMNQPALLLLDEPTTGLDPRQRMLLKELLVKLSKDTIVLLSTHIVSDIEALADWVILINHGQIVKMLPPDDLVQEMKAADSHVDFENNAEILSDLEKAYLFFCAEASD